MKVEDGFQCLDRKGTQSEFGLLVGITQQAVSAHVASNLLTNGSTLLEWLRAYCDQLRREAAGHKSSDGMDLTRERVLTERVDRDLKIITLHEKTGGLVPVSEVKPAMQAMVVAARTELLTMADKICVEIRTLHGIDIDDELVRGHVDNALKHLAEYAPDTEGDDAGGRSGMGAAA